MMKQLYNLNMVLRNVWVAKNKRPKGPHIVHLSTMCHLFEESARTGHFCFLIGPKNTNLVDDIEILLPVKFHWIPFSGFRGEVENVSANQRSGRPFCFSDPPEKYKLGWVELSWISCLTSQLTIFQSYMWRHIDVQADWRRSWTYGRAPDAIDIS